MAKKPCNYKFNGQTYSETDFKKMLSDGLLDKFVLDDNASIPSVFGKNKVNPNETAAQKFRAPVTEAAPTETPQSEEGKYFIDGKEVSKEEAIKEIQDESSRYDFNLSGKKIEYQGSNEQAAREIEEHNKSISPLNKEGKLKPNYIDAAIKKAFDSVSFRKFGDAYRRHIDPNFKQTNNETRVGGVIGGKKGMSWNELAGYIIGDGQNLATEKQFRAFAKELGLEVPTQATQTKTEPTTKAEPKPTTEKPGITPGSYKAKTDKGIDAEYDVKVDKEGKVTEVRRKPFVAISGDTMNPAPEKVKKIGTDTNGRQIIETEKGNTIYLEQPVAKVEEVAKEEAPVKEEAEGKGKPTKVKIYAREPKLDERGVLEIGRFNREIEFTKNKRAKSDEIAWETTVNGKKVKATPDQVVRIEKALAEQPKKTTKEKISDAFDALKIDTKGKALSIPIPPGIYNDIIEGAKQLVLKGIDIASAIKQATSKALAARKLADDVVKNVNDYTNSKEFTDKVNEALEGEERVSGIKKALTSKESKELAETGIERMTIKEALDAGQAAIESKEVIPDKLIASIIGVKNEKTGQYENGIARPLTVTETAAMVYYKATLDNELENAYNDLNKALDSKNVIDEKHAKSEIARLEEKVAEYEVMANVTAYQQGLSLKLRSMLLNSQYNLVYQKQKIKAQYKGKLPADVEERLNDLDKQLRETNAKLAELEKQRTKTEDEEVVKNIKETKDTEKKSAVSKDGKIKIPTADIRQAVLNGAATIDEVVDAVRDSVKAKFPKATDRQIRDAITNYGKSRSETKDAVQKKINEMKRVGRLLSELEDVQNGIKKTKNKIKIDALTEREIELKQKIKEELAKIPLTDEEIADLQAERLERFKKTSKKAIEELQKKIDNKDFDKKKRDLLLDLDKEAAELRAKREEIKYKFDLEFEKAQRNQMSGFTKFGESVLRVLSIPKSLKASLDFSAPGRQGSVFVLTQNPIKTLNQIGKQFEFWWSENSYNQWLNSVKSSEYYPLLKASGLYIAEPNAKLEAAEEALMSNFMNKIPLIGKTRVLKSGLKIKGLDAYARAERAYVGFLNNLRVQAFLDGAQKMSESGISPKTNIDEFKSWADYVNNATGRGTAGKKNLVGRGFEASAPALSLALFSPRFMWSRLNLTGINPSMYYRMSPTARKMAIKRTMGYFGMTSLILGLAALYLNNDDDDETSVELDPRSSDFAKIKIGNTRVDVLAGNQQVYRTIAQSLSGERKKLTTGEIEKLGQKYGSTTKLGIAGNFFVNKFSPIMSVIYKKYGLTEPEKKMREEEGEEGSDIKSIVVDLTIPLYIQDVKDLAKDHGPQGALGFTLLNVFGLSVQNMQPKTKSVEQSSPVMDEFESELYEDDSYDDFEKQEEKMLEGF